MGMKQILTGLIWIYQRVVSPWLGPHCRFYPTCSEWARQAIEMYGVLGGSGLALKRFLLCHPFHPGGYDPLMKEDG